MKIGILAIVGVALLKAAVLSNDARTIIQRSVAANERDWKAAPQYNYQERDRTGKGTKTYQVLMILGSPYNRLVARDGRALPASQQADEQRKLNAEIQRRRSESPAKRAARIQRYRDGRRQEHLMISQLTEAFDFHLTGQRTIGNHEVYVLEATPRAGYRPPNRDSKVLTGMRGELWVDTQTFQWVKVEAEVIHRVSIGGFLAVVEPGTRFEVEYTPVDEGIWLPSHYTMSAHAKVFYLVSHTNQEDETYFGYQKAAPLS